MRKQISTNDNNKEFQIAGVIKTSQRTWRGQPSKCRINVYKTLN